MKCGSSVFLAVAGLLFLTACSASDDQDGRELNLITEAESSIDTLTLSIVRNQQNLLRALTEDDVEVMAQFLAPRFIAYDLGTPHSPPSGGDANPRARQIQYMEVMAGKLRESVRPAYSAYHALEQGNGVIVYALDHEDAIRAVWQRTETGWIVTQFILTTSDEAKRLMAKDGE
jgi:hypothetical protein